MKLFSSNAIEDTEVGASAGGVYSNVRRVLQGVRTLVQDSWQSTLGGLGSRSDRGRVGSVAFCEQPTLTDYELSAAYRNLWLVRWRFQPDYAGRPWTLWTANEALSNEAGETDLRWVVVQP